MVLSRKFVSDYIDLDSNLTINANITINGKGHIIKGNKYLFIHPSI